MKNKILKPKDVGIPLFTVKTVNRKSPRKQELTLFDLSSHTRAGEAINFGLKMRNKGYHIFVVGEDRSGRMTSTMAFLKQHAITLPPPYDWVYLNNFQLSHRPKPYRLPNGMGNQLAHVMKDLTGSLHSLLFKTFSHPHYINQIESMGSSLETQVQAELEALKKFAKTKGFTIEESNEGYLIQVLDAPEQNKKRRKSPYSAKDVQKIKEQLSRITTSAHLASRQIAVQVKEAKRNIAAQVIHPLFKGLRTSFDKYIKDWIDELYRDVLDHINDFLNEDPETESKLPRSLEERYSVNLLVNNANLSHPQVVLEPLPTYENLFGAIKYRAIAGGGMETDFTLIRPGALHRANGGILVLRAEALAQAPEVWEALKGALRDRRIRLDERQRESSMPLLDAPAPLSIPMDVQVFIIGAPLWYYSVFFNDPDFKAYFKIKAEIDPDLPVTPKNLSHYAQLIRQSAIHHTGQDIEPTAIQYLMGYSSRWVGHRHKLSARFELIADILSEAGTVALMSRDRVSTTISLGDVKTALHKRRKRTARLEDRSHEDIEEGQILIDTTGSVVGQVNGLSVLSTGDHQYGLPNRITARVYAGTEPGIVNIERLADMSGPIQQKGVLILDGYLKGMFAQDFPLSCGCSITFEQNYGGVEGDSASLAELVAILSSLSNIPIRQDIAVTGSINQRGEVQPVGGVIHKIEGYYRTCHHRGLTGTQGVILPHTNINNLVLRDDIVESISRGKFFIRTVHRIEDALELLTDTSSKKIFNETRKRLASYYKSLKKLR